MWCTSIRLVGYGHIKGTCQGRKEDWSWPPTHECSIYRQWHWFIIKQAPFKEDSQLLSFSLLSLQAEQCSDTLCLVCACMCSLSQLLRARALSIIWKVEVAWPMGSHFVEWWGSLLRRWVRRTSPHFVACHFTLRQTIRLTLSTPNLDAIISLVVLYLLLRLDQKVFDHWGVWNRFFIHKNHIISIIILAL